MRKKTMQELQRKTVSEFKAAEKIPLIAVLDNVRSICIMWEVYFVLQMLFFSRQFISADIHRNRRIGRSIKQRSELLSQSAGLISHQL